MAGAAPTTAFGQAVIGPPGSGKTTYCLGMSEFLRALGRRVAVVNLDPANEGLPYECAVDVGELVGLGDVMDALQLGPNGGLLYCMEYLEANLDWLRAKLDPLRGHYFLFDCPGQVELCTHHGALRSIFSQMAQWDLRLTAVHLVDSHYCTDPAKFISVLCTSLATMLHVELPHVNLLSKMDLIEHYGKLAFNLDYYTEVLDLSYLLDHLASDPFFHHYRQLNEKLVQLIEDYSLVSFIPLNIQDKESIQRVLQAVDKANGYCFGVQEQRSLEAVMSAAVGADFHFSSYPCSLASATAKSGRPGAQEWPCLPLQMTDFMLTSGLPGNWSLGRFQGCLYLRTREAVDQKAQQIQRPRYERALVT
ncbi:GPN-loop GTPase 2 isoform X1 [Monodon monoceros]|uniref:GPN-loop GTPase 2 isoform X1 n=1 Tax=Monodon monoceros TaxID=40151 RepID=UPI0010F71AAC|nr:GPN-loop GTPase 2 isoform X1 [Monodon monoceros]